MIRTFSFCLDLNHGVCYKYLMDNDLKSSEMRPHHQTVRVTAGERSILVDSKMAALILAIWAAGINTSQCCQENEPGVAWIQFPTAPFALKFLGMVHTLSNEWLWTNDLVRFHGDTEDNVSLRFPANRIRKITKLLAERNGKNAAKVQ